MIKHLLGCLAATAALVLVPAAPASADPIPDPEDVIQRVSDSVNPLDDACVRNYENLEGDVCSPVDGDAPDRLKTFIEFG